MKVAWISCRKLPEPDPDETEGLAALRDRGHEVSVVAWDDPELRLEGFDVSVLRSTWNYPEQPDAFRQFLERERGNIWNPSEVTRWNMHKGYLLELERGGVPIVPTELGRPGDDAGAMAEARGWSDVVVKPAIGAGSMGTRRFADLSEARAHGGALGGDFLVQPALSAFEEPGERSLVWVHGVYTHVIVKRPRLAGDEEGVRLLGSGASDAEMALADKALSFAPGPILYARVDYVRHGDELLLSELELIEPSLFWFLGGAASASLDRLVAGLEARAGA